MIDSSTRQAAVRVARAILAARPVYLDTETTGLERTDEIVEICILDSDGSALVDSLVRPRRAIPADVVRVHGITNEMVCAAPAWPELWPAVARALCGRPVAIYNAEFDVRMLQQSHRRHGMPWEMADLGEVCLMQLYAQYRGDRDPRRGGYRWHRLEEAGRQCRIALPNAHRARADTLLARALLHYMAEQAG